MKLLAALSLVFMVGCNDCDPVTLVPYCPENAACWPGPNGTLLGEDIPSIAHNGECFVGNVVCFEDQVLCEGFVLPSEEICDGLDNDCNERTDELQYLGPFHSENDCSLCGVCALAFKECRGGVWQCLPAIAPSDEDCNGLDDDCDCETDEGLDEPSFSYPDETYPDTVGVGECRPGVRVCRHEQWQVTEPVLPSEEICDGGDNDCDGLVDERLPQDPQAFLLVIDVSGSMGGTINAVADGLCDFTIGSEADSRFAIVTVSYGTPPHYLEFRQDFADAAETCVTLNELSTTGNGLEYMLEGVALSSGMDWPEGLERNTVSFTDEEIQYPGPGSAVPGWVMDDCVLNSYHVSAMVEPVFASEWQGMANYCGGFVDYLVDDRYLLAQKMLRHFFGECG